MEERIKKLEEMVIGLRTICNVQQVEIEELKRLVFTQIDMARNNAEFRKTLLEYCKALREEIEEVKGST